MSNEEPILPENKFAAAMIRLPDGRVAFDAVKLAQIETEGVFLKDHPHHEIAVRTLNTLYTLYTDGAIVECVESKLDGSLPRFMQRREKINVHCSTFGGSMLKIGYLGIGMHMQFFTQAKPFGETTSPIQSIKVTEIAAEKVAA